VRTVCRLRVAVEDDRRRVGQSISVPNSAPIRRRVKEGGVDSIGDNVDALPPGPYLHELLRHLLGHCVYDDRSTDKQELDPTEEWREPGRLVLCDVRVEIGPVEYDRRSAYQASAHGRQARYRVPGMEERYSRGLPESHQDDRRRDEVEHPHDQPEPVSVEECRQPRM